MSSVFNALGFGNGSSGPPNERPAGGVKLIPNRIFVGGMSRETTDEDLFQAFSGYGQVRSTKIITDTEGNSKGYGKFNFLGTL